MEPDDDVDRLTDAAWGGHFVLDRVVVVPQHGGEGEHPPFDFRLRIPVPDRPLLVAEQPRHGLVVAGVDGTEEALDGEDRRHARVRRRGRDALGPGRARREEQRERRQCQPPGRVHEATSHVPTPEDGETAPVR